jgi:hypothetical protein
MSADLLALLERQRPDLSPTERLALIADTPDARPTEKPAQRRVGSRSRTSASMERRRSWAASGRLPPKLAARFTVAEQAVLAVIASEVIKKDTCTLTLEHIAALAGVCRTTVKNALREAAGLELIRVEERRLSAWRNLPHKITITAPEWITWLRLRRRGEGANSCNPRPSDIRKQEAKRPNPSTAKGFRRGRGAELAVQRQHDSARGTRHA